tara:strand:+ start:1716 stop:3770 length:2055 start_codon:yes stop_codon:yes gene_type:complete
MASFVSPGVYVVEKDLSDYPVAINPSIVGIVGFANQGPTNKATLVTSQEQLIQTFGNPSESITGQGLEGAIEILEATNSLYYVRAAGSNSADASAAVPVGSCPAVQVSALGVGTTQAAYFKVQVNVDGVDQYATPKTFAAPANTSTGSDASQAKALKSVFGGGLAGSPIASYYTDTTDGNTKGWITAGYAGSGVVLGVSAYSDSAYSTPSAILQIVDASGDPADPATTTASVTGVSILSTGTTSSLAYSVQSLYPGIGYNEGTKADGTTSGFSVEVRKTGGINTDVQINKNGTASESFVMGLAASGSFAEDVLNTGSTDLKSSYVKGYFTYAAADTTVTALPTFESQIVTSFTGQAVLGSDATTQRRVNPRFCKFINGTTSLAGGLNGDETVPGDIVGSTTDKTGIYALDNDTLNISMAITPGVTNQSVQNALVTLAESSQNFLAVVSPPEGLTTVQQAIDWSNGQSDERTASLASNYAAVYWPWVKTFDTIAQKDRYYDPAIFAIRQMAYTDEVGEPWFAPAGVVRGRLSKPTEVEVSVNQGDRDSMYSGGNIVNPIVNFPQQGIMIFGQRTAQRTPTALDRVNVRRLLIVIRKQLLASTRRFVFEPNDATTWEKVVNVVDPLLSDIQRRRGLVEYRVVCDESTNTTVRVDRNELWCKVLLKPTKTAEIVVFELNLTNQSATL